MGSAERHRKSGLIAVQWFPTSPLAPGFSSSCLKRILAEIYVTENEMYINLEIILSLS